MTRKEFVDKAWDAAVDARQRGAPISVPIAVAQAALETGFGTSELSTLHNNLFGIKGDYRGESVTYTTEEQDRDGGVATIKAEFKSYPDWTNCFWDYADIIERLPWYEDAEDAANIPRDYLTGLIPRRGEDGTVIEPGWATDHRYFQKVWSIVEENDLLNRSEDLEDEYSLLQVYDNSKRIDYTPIRVTVGATSNGGTKIMVRVVPTTFLKRLRYLVRG